MAGADDLRVEMQQLADRIIAQAPPGGVNHVVVMQGGGDVTPEPKSLDFSQGERGKFAGRPLIVPPEPQWPAPGSRWYLVGLGTDLDLRPNGPEVVLDCNDYPQHLIADEVRALVAALQAWLDAQEPK